MKIKKVSSIFRDFSKSINICFDCFMNYSMVRVDFFREAFFHSFGHS